MQQRYLYLLLLLLSSTGSLFGQKHDYVWTGGENINNPAITGGFLINFRNGAPKVTSRPREMNLFRSSACISDEGGFLKAYTNGCDIASGINDSIMENGGQINPGVVYNTYCNTDNPNTGFGYYPNASQSSMFLPLPDTNGIYYLFHKRVHLENNPFSVLTDMLFYSVVDMHYNNGRGKVTQKNIPLMQDSLAAGMMTAVKHANGKDWWILTPRNTENQIYTFLFTQQGIVDTILQHIGFNLDEDGSCQVTFSPDGSKFITCNPYTGLGIFDFDRSSGLLSNYQTIDIAPYIWEWTDFTGCAVSPNNRFVYVSSTKHLLQYDLFAENIADSRVLIDTWDGAANPLATTFGPCHAGPDCKIYIQTGQQAKNLHVIHRPDEPGTQCDFEQRGLVLTNANRGSLPYFPYYRLGPSDNPGVPCTAVSSAGEEAPPTLLPPYSVFPNPATDYLRVIANQYFQEPSRFQLFDFAGRVVWQQTLSDPASTLTVPQLPPGLYFYQIQNENQIRCSGKLLLQRAH